MSASSSSSNNPNEVDPHLRKAVILLHSTNPTSATEMRQMLDELMKQRWGPTKTITSLIGKKKLLEWEENAPGIVHETEAAEEEEGPCTSAAAAAASSAAAAGTADEIINLTNSPAKTISDSPDTIHDSDEGAGMLTMATSEEVENLKEFGDLNCCVCGEIMFTATNRLIECSLCGTLYHQECHKPAITDEETADGREHTWQCNSCNDKPSTSRAAAAAVGSTISMIDPPATSSQASSSAVSVTQILHDEPMALTKSKSSASSSRSSCSSNSSSPFYKQEHSSSSSAGKHHKSSSSSSKSHKEERSASKGVTSAGNIVTPAINVISAPDKSSTSGSSSKKSSSSSTHTSSKSSKSSSKHHDSSKRKFSK